MFSIEALGVGRFLRRVATFIQDPAFPILSGWPLPRSADWLETVNQPQSEAELDALRREVRRSCRWAARAGRPRQQNTWKSSQRCVLWADRGRRNE